MPKSTAPHLDIPGEIRAKLGYHIGIIDAVHVYFNGDEIPAKPLTPTDRRMCAIYQQVLSTFGDAIIELSLDSDYSAQMAKRPHKELKALTRSLVATNKHLEGLIRKSKTH